MQTFLPYSDFQRCAEVLDYRRLGKQRVECMQILNAITGERASGWKHHPIVKMWDGYHVALVNYGNTMIDEWKRRGYKNTMDLSYYDDSSELIYPDWIYDSELQLSHRSNLVRKLPEHYRQFWPEIDNNLPYKWVTT